MTENYVHIKEVAIKNNCPECYSNDGLHINFRQKIKETKLYKSITSEITHDIVCKTCNSTIYPVSWSNDLERVFDYHQRALKPMKPSTYIKKTSWIVIAVVLTVILFGIFMVFYAENL